jgi:hypothetical protein
MFLISNLPNEISEKILLLINLRDIYNYCCCNKINQYKFKLKLIDKINKVKKWFPPVVWELMNGISTLVFAPELEFKDKFIGVDYIDGIEIKDVTAPIMIGIDKYKRPFITIRTIEKKNNYSNVITIFQRYTNDKGTWTHGIYGNSYLVDCIPRIISRYKIQPDKIKENLKNLINNYGYIFWKNMNNEYIKLELNLLYT